MQKIKVNPKAKANFRPGTARAEYYDAICKFNGKSVESFAKAVAESPPAVPQRGKLQGQAEPVRGWISFFVRGGYISLES